MKNLPVAWTKHLKSQKEREDFEKVVRNSTLVLSRLKEILEERLDTIDRMELSHEAYENPAWAYKQAFWNGDRKGLTRALELLEFMD